ncbi:AraC family transcriptional regulator [uncultured Cohaesibacter sp.]|uniref:helix-turn-helix transcriptional regulator n=1 Tax=uncultured Cohaesibacter sp. TaxID=1002546 RepID=UPI0029C73237|nr:AraC family transcriptional regulator [uncultured Cohaesibacter sp.]
MNKPQMPSNLQAQIVQFPGDFLVGVMNHSAERIDYTGSSVMQPKFHISIHLTGCQEFCLEDKKILMDATKKPLGIMMRVEKQSEMTYVRSQGGPFRKVQLCTPLSWLDQLCQPLAATDLQSPLIGHLDYVVWEVSSEIARLADQLIFPPPSETKFDHGLFRMSRGLEIFRRALAETTSQTFVPEIRRTTRTPEDIRLYILAHLDKDLSLMQLEDHFHINRRSLQRIFKSKYGQTLSDFIRIERLNKAHVALKHYGMTISEAAFVAGYSSSANFTTAFRKEFGVPPSVVQHQVI